MDFMVVSDRDFWGWQNPAGTSPEQPQIATMKEKSSHSPRKERLELSRHVLGEQKNDRSNMSISKLNFESRKGPFGVSSGFFRTRGKGDLGVRRPWRRNSVSRPGTSTLGVVYAAAQLSRPVVPRLRGR
ncbi:hypothetical protein F2Q69_00010766 [Brassica cretica]|uniref:Uncharacterized protein n=1 Tax=Brassica cretica TaxID=69181 RepID=A0A8S9R8Z4_BRACR|nr:hypothetical protein F2Q69_00010766 [Brassica cretica]